MNHSILFSLDNHVGLANSISQQLNTVPGQVYVHQFPDQETYIRIDSDVKDKTVFVICGLHHPNAKILPLIYFLKTARELGANQVILVTPYLPYLRQDKRFKPGETISANVFAELLSRYLDGLITIDPHLHRINNLSEIFNLKQIQTRHAIIPIADWIKNNIASPYLIGPDDESTQWVSKIASLVACDYVTLEKTRYGDHEVSITISHTLPNNITPVFIDDIISSGTSIITAMKQLHLSKQQHAVSICVHALFNDEAEHSLIRSGLSRIISCNTIPHHTNLIDISNVISDAIMEMSSSF